MRAGKAYEPTQPFTVRCDNHERGHQEANKREWSAHSRIQIRSREMDKNERKIYNCASCEEGSGSVPEGHDITKDGIHCNEAEDAFNT